ncbi:hypothetical protein DXG03_003144 [Asterophora parasitica]|uniref:Uncharacterized protein n=1 Tax=Asterophora parasitica TaxID=117018 RepID=A0A9P7GEE8_9AGAR|nr:hypothetical protein DXG03_003144 [Asterophora parasitica]
MNSLYTSGVRQTNSLQADLERLRNGDNSASLLGQISASLAAMHRTIDDYDSMAKREIIKAKQEKAQMRVQKFRTDYAELRTQFDALKIQAAAEQAATQRANLISSSGSGSLPSPSDTRRRFQTTNPQHSTLHPGLRPEGEQHSESPFRGPTPQSGFGGREYHALEEHSFIHNTETRLDEFLAQGREVLDNLVDQRNMLKGTQRRLLDTANTLGLSRNVIGWIERRREELHFQRAVYKDVPRARQKIPLTQHLDGLTYRMRFHLFLFAISAWCIVVTAIPAMSPLGLSMPFSSVQRTQLHFLDSFQSDFWQSAKALGDKLVTYTNDKLHEAALQIPVASAKIDEFRATMSQVIAGAKDLREDLERHARSISAEEISERLSAELEVVYDRFKAEFSLPLPEDHDARHEERIKMIDWTMSEVHVVLVKVLPIPEADTNRRFREMEPHIKHFLLVIGACPGLPACVTSLLLLPGLSAAFGVRPSLKAVGLLDSSLQA